jgi:type I restriction enzyme S subunit
MKEKVQAPELRFPGFTDDWEERKAKEMIKTHHFRSYLAEPNDVGNYEVIQQGDKPIAGYANGEPFEYFYDVTLFGDHTVSLFKPTKPFFIATDGVKIISADEFDGRYFYVTLERYKPASQGYKRHFTILKNEDIWFTTNKDEQVKIGTFFKQLDDTIALHQRKLDLLKEQKKGYLQKMFPKNGAKVPELRFEGFADDWELRKIEDILKNIKGSMKIGPFGSALKKEYYVEKGIKVYAQENIFKNDFSLGNYYITEDKYLELQSCELIPGDIVISMMGTIGACSVFPETSEKGIMNSHLLRLQTNDSSLAEYIALQIKDSPFIKQQILKLSVGSIMSGLSSTVVKKLKFPIPSIEEQRKIYLFFKQLDDTITLHQRKLDLLKEQKKGFLQKMFV